MLAMGTIGFAVNFWARAVISPLGDRRFHPDDR